MQGAKIPPGCDSPFGGAAASFAAESAPYRILGAAMAIAAAGNRYPCDESGQQKTPDKYLSRVFDEAPLDTMHYGAKWKIAIKRPFANVPDTVELGELSAETKRLGVVTSEPLVRNSTKLPAWGSELLCCGVS